MKKGISFTILAITVLIMVILLTSITIAGSSTVNNSKKLSFATEISTIQMAVESYKQKNNSYPTKDSVVIDIGDLNDYSRSQFTNNGEDIQLNRIVLNEIDYEKLSMTSLRYGNLEEGENDLYVVSPKTGKVYYAKGMKIGTKLYFSLTDELNKTLSGSTSTKVSNTTTVIFAPTKIDWTKDDVSVDVKVPLSCTLYNISIDGEIISNYATKQETGYNVYTLSKQGNYSILVRYTQNEGDDEIFNAVYNVNNVDNIVPYLQIDQNIVPLKTKYESNIVGYFKILNKSDSLSGVKKIKYEKNSVYATNISDEQKNKVKEHFENNGNDVLNNVIPIEKGAKQVTVYLEDNAGNWSLQTLDINGI